MDWVTIISLVTAGIALVKMGLLSFVEVKAVLDKYQALEATPANIEAARQELLTAAHIPQAVDDPAIRAELQKLGIDPETLRIVA